MKASCVTSLCEEDQIAISYSTESFIVSCSGESQFLRASAMEIFAHMLVLLGMYLNHQQGFCREISKPYAGTPPSADQLLSSFHKPPWGGASSTASQAGRPRRDDGVESCGIKNIPGTSLYSCVYYRGGTTTPKGGIFSYDSIFPLLVVEAIPENTRNYEEGGRWYGKDQWMFKEALDFPGWFELHNKYFPKGLATWSGTKTGNGYYLRFETNPVELNRLGVGGDLRENALWQVVSVDDNYFQLKLKQFSQGTVTQLDKLIDKHQHSSHYLQVSTNSDLSQYYKKGGKWYEDTLFTFTSPSVQPKGPSTKNILPFLQQLD